MIPKSINVLGLRVKIKQVKNLKLDGHLVHGYFDPQNAVICIEKEISDEHKWRTLFHELSHVLTFRNGLTFTGFPSSMDEILAETNSSMIYELMNQLFGSWHD
jgi:Zn-dependent peptidase ImmA (M78 family)